MIEVARVSSDFNLTVFNYWLHSEGVAHQFIEELNEQVLFIENEAFRKFSNDHLQLYLTDKKFRLLVQNTPKNYGNQPLYEALYPRAMPGEAPLVYGFIFLSAIFAVLTDFGHGGPILRSFLILDPISLRGEDFAVDLNTLYGRIQGLWFTLQHGEVWRLFSPGFIHFSVMHITFNVLMLWLLGGQLEIQKGSVAFLLLAMFVLAISNVAQLFETSYLFGGLSGVVYGLVGYCWLWKHYEPEIFFPDILMKFSLAWLVLGYTPLTEWLGWGRMANAAHLYGLISGLVWGGLMVALRVIKRKKYPD